MDFGSTLIASFCPLRLLRFARSEARHRGARPDDLDDIAQQAVLAILVHASELREPLAYLRIVVRNLSAKFRRDQIRREEVEESLEQLITEEREPLEHRAPPRELQAVVRFLSPFERHLLFELATGAKPAEIAARLRTSPGAIRVRSYRLRKRLRAAL
ncbi:MAG: RNA polymerase sigma factor [Thermoanaerobaculia bacterium]